MTGTKGSVCLEVDGTEGTFEMSWSNPFIGGHAVAGMSRPKSTAARSDFGPRRIQARPAAAVHVPFDDVLIRDGHNPCDPQGHMSLADDFASKTIRPRHVASMLHRQLKRDTGGLHRRLEEELGLLEPGLSIDRYCRVLQCFHGFYAPVEAGLARLAAARPALPFPLRSRSELIARDLSSLGLAPREIADLPRCTDLPRLSSPEELAGCLYVIEGACLGGQVVAPALFQRLGVAKGSGASFFIGDADGTVARWLLVLAWLEGLARMGARTQEIVASARATFLSFAQWAERHGRPE